MCEGGDAMGPLPNSDAVASLVPLVQSPLGLGRRMMRDPCLGPNSGVQAVIMVISRPIHVSRNDILSPLSSHGCDCVFLGLHLDVCHMYVTLLT